MKFVNGVGGYHFKGIVAGAVVGAIVGALFGALAGNLAAGLGGGTLIGSVLGEFIGAALEDPGATKLAEVEEQWSPAMKFTVLILLALLFWVSVIAIAWFI